MSVKPGSLVKYREREWIVIPEEDPELVRLRPVGGSLREECTVWKSIADLVGYDKSYERIEQARFPMPDPDYVQDHIATRLLLDASKLLLREGATPFSSFGKISTRPRPYQLVPLIMALRLETVRLLIADDVGIGKTIEGALIARELLDRGEIGRLVVLCPPYLCDQWQKELEEKFQIDATVVRSGTVSRLERKTPTDTSVFEYFPFMVASIDLVKSDRYRASFIEHCPEMVIIDEVHGAVEYGGRSSTGKQQRHKLVSQLAKDLERHLVLLTATPHSGIESSFLSILELLNPEFRHLDLNSLSENERKELAKHFIQRRRADVENWLGETPFPDRIEKEEPYIFSQEYRKFYNKVYQFADELVQSAEELTGWKKRMRFWAALTLLRCITSSPASAESALRKRIQKEEGDEADTDPLEFSSPQEVDGAFRPVVHEPDEVEQTVDTSPATVFDSQEKDPDWKEKDKQRLRSFAREASNLKGEADAKIQKLKEVVAELLEEGYQPIIWCRYIATSDYVAEELQKYISKQYPKGKVISVTGKLGEDERRLKVEELANFSPGLLVATECLSEGINLQEYFDAVVHYDLPWNPNRLEQRDGRVDRFGQTSTNVKTVLIYGQNNPVDGAILDVLIRKANEIKNTLGIRVPVPMDSETVIEAVMGSLFRSKRSVEDKYQLTIFDIIQDADTQEMVEEVHKRWDRSAEKEKESRSRFAQRTIKPEEVEQELNKTDSVLGDAKSVQNFLLHASERLNFNFQKINEKVWKIDLTQLPQAVIFRLREEASTLNISFYSPTPKGATFVGRNHPLVEGLSEHLLSYAFYPTNENIPVSRCSVIRTNQINRRTALYLLRLRFVINRRGKKVPSFAEETFAWGVEGIYPDVNYYDLRTSQEILDDVKPTSNVMQAEKQTVLKETLSWWDNLETKLQEVVNQRAEELQNSHERISKLLKQGQLKIEPQFPPDLLGLMVILPEPKGAVQ